MNDRPRGTMLTRHEVDEKLIKAREAMERSYREGNPVTFEDALIFHLWERIVSLEGRVETLTRRF